MYLTVSSLVLAALLFIPVSKLIWTVSVRRLQRKEQRELSQDELDGQLRRARFISVPVVLAFSALYVFNVFGGRDGG